VKEWEKQEFIREEGRAGRPTEKEENSSLGSNPVQEQLERSFHLRGKG